MKIRSISSTSLFVLMTLSQVQVACVSEKTSVSSSIADRVSPYYDGPSELSYCSSATSYSDTVTITGTATFQARELYSGGLGNAGSTQPIRYAEVRVLNSGGTVVQCGETNNSGQFSISLPRGNSSYTIQVNSRSFNNNLKASVLDRPERNLFYSLTTSVKANATQDIGTLNAGVTGSLLGGAFNILEQLLLANEFLRTEVGTCSFSGCDDFTVAEKVFVYWEKGFNPGSYFDLSSGLSFYLPTYSRLFILGGIDGDTDSSDTDHFDNSVIIHEYGHFIEDIFATSDSPGGSHSGNSVIDPRLAWGEGWANFFQAAVRDDSFYADTTGNIDGSTDYFFNINVEDNTSLCASGSTTPGCDEPENSGEGNFREFSIARMLWDIHDTSAGDTGTDTVDGNFEEIWAAFSTSFDSSIYAFRQIGLLHDLQANLTGPTDWSTNQTTHDHQADRTDYGLPITTGSSCSMNFTIVPTSVSGDSSGSFSTSHLLLNNDFYYYKHTGGSLTLKLNYTTASGTEADIDLYLYNEDARFGQESDMEGFSREEPDGSTGDVETETVSVSNLAAGNYLVNVFVYTGGASVGSSSTYELEANGADLCP